MAASDIDVIDRKLSGRLLQVKRRAYLLDVVEEERGNTKGPYLEALQVVLKEFEDVFRSLQGLPPSRNCDHKIPLQDPHFTVNVRPYRHPFHQKNEI